MFIPIFDKLIYPALEKCGLLTEPLPRMVVGGLLTAIAFTLSGLLEFKLEVRNLNLFIWKLSFNYKI